MDHIRKAGFDMLKRLKVFVTVTWCLVLITGCATVQEWYKDYSETEPAETNAVPEVVVPDPAPPVPSPVPPVAHGFVPTTIPRPEGYVAPVIVSQGEEESLGRGGRLPSIAVDSLNQPHIVYDIAGSSKFQLYDKVGGKWYHQTYDSKGGSHQFYGPTIEINSKDEAWISGTMWHPEGAGVLYRYAMSVSPQNGAFVYNKGGHPGLPVCYLSLDVDGSGCANWAGNGGYWSWLVYSNGAIAQTAKGYLTAGSGGEKNAFFISRSIYFPHGAAQVWQRIWHTATDWSYNNSLRSAWRLRNVVWADYKYYPEMGDDGAYPFVTSDVALPQTAYMLSTYRGVVLNIWHGTDGYGGGGFVFDPKGGLLVLDPKGTSGMRRFPPQAWPAREGIWATWTSQGYVMICYVPNFATTNEDLGPCVWFKGSISDICVDANDDLHVTYHNGGLKYRKIEVTFGNK